MSMHFHLPSCWYSRRTEDSLDRACLLHDIGGKFLARSPEMLAGYFSPLYLQRPRSRRVHVKNAPLRVNLYNRNRQHVENNAEIVDHRRMH